MPYSTMAMIQRITMDISTQVSLKMRLYIQKRYAVCIWAMGIRHCRKDVKRAKTVSKNIFFHILKEKTREDMADGAHNFRGRNVHKP